MEYFLKKPLTDFLISSLAASAPQRVTWYLGDERDGGTLRNSERRKMIRLRVY